MYPHEPMAVGLKLDDEFVIIVHGSHTKLLSGIGGLSARTITCNDEVEYTRIA